MTVVFADTFYYLAWVNPKDAAHAAARQFAANFSGSMITTFGVLLEVGNAMCRAANRASFLTVVEEIRADSMTSVLQIDEAS